MILSIIVPSIRPENVKKLFESVDFDGEWQMIVVGPTCPSFFDKRLNFIYSRRNPNAAQQMGLCVSTGQFITFAADDGVFIPGALNLAFFTLLCSSEADLIDPHTILVGKYLEGDNHNPDMEKEDYYKFKYHKSYRIKGVPQDNLIFNCGIISRKLIFELGGWDCRFQATTCAHADLGIRACQAGAKMILMKIPLFKCSHQPGKTGDHKPIHEAMKDDLRLFKNLYSLPRKTNIDVANWKLTDLIWKKRFK